MRDSAGVGIQRRSSVAHLHRLTDAKMMKLAAMLAVLGSASAVNTQSSGYENGECSAPGVEGGLREWGRRGRTGHFAALEQQRVSSEWLSS